MQTQIPKQITAVVGIVRRSRLRWAVRRMGQAFVAMVTLWLFAIGPWPSDNSSFVESRYQAQSIKSLQAAPLTSSPVGLMQVGVAEADISPPPGHPLAGYSARKEKGYGEVDSRCFTRALTVATGTTKVTIVTADILLINAAMSKAIVEKTGLPAEELYFTASHTHSGPGGWGDHPIEKLIAGAYDPAFFRTLVDTISDVILRSREKLIDAEMGILSTPTKDRQANRLERGAPLDDRLLALVFRAVQAPAKTGATPPPLAILMVYSAHATMCGSSNSQLSADYPGAMVDTVAKKTGCPAVMFAAGAVGEATPIKQLAHTEQEGARLLGHLLADDLTKALGSVKYEREIELAMLRTPVELPAFRIPISSKWRVSPICSSWISNRQSHLHAVRIGSAVLVGFPGDYAGRLATPWVERCRERGLTLMTTSFNGDYKGYLVPEQAFMNIAGYETREMNFFGPWSGEYLTDLGERLVERVAPTGQ
ncbi:MAG: neutral/alkaline non-lysosomal ceramidase N-terminal domain-containing protein [Planctomycetes bacterium]|nr:neutral/alkaline non-lysosomal ceramidase N-terminal domain-containing protein [Planctomycetota bacterium]